MIRFIVKEVYVGHVLYANGQPETKIVSFDGDQEGLERFLRYKDCKGEKQPEFTVRELIGVEFFDA